MKKEDIVSNVVYYTTDFETLVEVVKKQSETKNSNILTRDFTKMLMSSIARKSCMVLVSFDEEKKLNGCWVISRHQDKKGDYLWFDFRWNDPHNVELFDKFYNEALSVCKATGIKRAQGSSDRCFRVVKRYYGAHEIGRIFEINIEEASMKGENKG
jgi:hypothetical protein